MCTNPRREAAFPYFSPVLPYCSPNSDMSISALSQCVNLSYDTNITQKCHVNFTKIICMRSKIFWTLGNCDEIWGRYSSKLILYKFAFLVYNSRADKPVSPRPVLLLFLAQYFITARYQAHDIPSCGDGLCCASFLFFISWGSRLVFKQFVKSLKNFQNPMDYSLKVCYNVEKPPHRAEMRFTKGFLPVLNRREIGIDRLCHST